MYYLTGCSMKKTNCYCYYYLIGSTDCSMKRTNCYLMTTNCLRHY